MSFANSIILIGYGEVGRALADQIAATGAALTCVDPACAGDHAGRTVLPALPDDLTSAIVLAVVPSAAASIVAREAAPRGAALYVDLSSSPQALMRDLAKTFPADTPFVDGAIMGSVDLTGAATPIILSGEQAGMAAAQLSALGLNASALPNSAPGDACGLKLLRTLMTKGMEALAVECFSAAERMHLGPQIRANLMDVNARPFPDLLDAMVRTHMLHAPRRRHEVAAALAQAGALGLRTPVTEAVLDAYRHTAHRIHTEKPADPATVREAVDWLASGLSDQPA